MTRKRSRPSKYTKVLAREVCERMAAGESLRHICTDDHMPSETAVRGWALDDVEGFSTQYTRAIELRAMRWAEEILDIADDGSNDSTSDITDHDHINRSWLRVDTRKWLLSKVLPKVYGDKLQHTGEGGGPVSFVMNLHPGNG